MNQNQTTPTENEAAMMRVLEAAQKVAPPWALPLTIDDIETHPDDDGRGALYSGFNFGEDMEGDVILRLSMRSAFDGDGNLLARGEVEPHVHISEPRGRAFTSKELMAMRGALSRLNHELLNAGRHGQLPTRALAELGLSTLSTGNPMFDEVMAVRPFWAGDEVIITRSVQQAGTSQYVTWRSQIGRELTGGLILVRRDRFELDEADEYVPGSIVVGSIEVAREDDESSGWSEGDIEHASSLLRLAAANEEQ